MPKHSKNVSLADVISSVGVSGQGVAMIFPYLRFSLLWELRALYIHLIWGFSALALLTSQESWSTLALLTPQESWCSIVRAVLSLQDTEKQHKPLLTRCQEKDSQNGLPTLPDVPWGMKWLPVEDRERKSRESTPPFYWCIVYAHKWSDLQGSVQWVLTITTRVW